VVVLGVLARMIPDQKTLFFGLLCLWFLLVIGFIAGLDYIRQSYRRAHDVAEMSEDELQLAVADKGEKA
jgi:putative membrane protein